MFRKLFSKPGPRHADRRELELALQGELDTAGLLRNYMLYVIFPLWLLSGVLDYGAHRKSHIEDTAGTTESLIHIIMLGLAGGPVVMALLLEINSLVLAIMGTAFVAHDITSIVDGYYALPRRRFTGAEQHIHSYMEGLPFMSFSAAALLYWRQFLAIFGAGPERPRWMLEPKRRPLSGKYLAGILTAIALFGVLPYAEELWRCHRAEQKRQKVRPEEAA